MLSRKLSAVNLKDLLFVVLYTIIISIAFGILLGYADYFLISTINFSFIGFLYWIIAIYLGTTIRKVVGEAHLVYTVIAAIGMVLSFAIIDTVPIFLFNGITLQDYQIFLDIRFYLENLFYTLNPITGLGGNLLNYIITILVFGVGTYLGIQKTIQ